MPAEEEQRKAADALRQAALSEEGSGNVSKPPSLNPRTQPAEQAEGGAEAQADPAQQMTVEQILAKEQQDRRNRQLQRVGIVAVEKDW